MYAFTLEQARASGFHPLTNGFKLPDEQRMLDNVVADMELGGIMAVLVGTPDGPEVWRKPRKVAEAA